jgi:hypothetical protein
MFGRSKSTADAAHVLAAKAITVLEEHMKTCDKRQSHIDTELSDIKKTQNQSLEVGNTRHQDNIEAIGSIKVWVLTGAASVLLLVLGSILVQSFHFHLSVGGGP